MVSWITLPNKQKLAILSQVANAKGISEQVVEKDAWVTLVLEALFSLPDIAEHLVFKGGTSLSKGYNLIGRFSEDIDFAIGRDFLGFNAPSLTNSQIHKLRKASSDFIKDRLVPQLRARLLEMGLPESTFSITWNEHAQPDTDPLPVNVEYKSVAGTSQYLAPDKVILEISARSLLEPAEARQIKSLIGEIYPHQVFAGNSFDVPTILPTKTFLDKIFLLHEQFLQPEQSPPRNRMSRHLYDVEKLMSTKYAMQALKDRELFEHTVAHRKSFTPIKGISYDKHTLADINILPPEEVLSLWEKDYSELVTHMVVGEALDFKMLIGRLQALQNDMRQIVWQ